MGIRLVGIDLDDTFLDKEKKIPEENLRAVEEALALGIEVMPVTGRPLNSIPGYILGCAPFRQCIACGGAAAYSLPGRELLFEELIEQRVARELAGKLEEAGFIVNVYAGGIGYVNISEHKIAASYGRSPAIREYLLNYRTPVPDIYDVIEENPAGVEKLTASGPRDETGRLIGAEKVLAVTEPYGEYVSVFYSPEISIEVNGKYATKGNAILRLAEMLGIAPEETMAIGDSANDLDMIRKAALGVAVSNASPDVLKEADAVVSSASEGGVAEAIRRFVLTEL